MDEFITIFRGINATESDVGKIKDEGIQGTSGFVIYRDKIEQYFNDDNLSTDLTQNNDANSKIDFTFGCADRMGAEFYATRDEKKDCRPYIIEMRVPLDSLFIDGRDFLYTCFQLWDNYSTSFFEQQSLILNQIFGSGISKYFQHVKNNSNQSFRIATCDLACQDIDVVKSHLTNTLVINGRYNTIFKTAFRVRCPISPKNIISISTASFVRPTINVDIEGFLKGKH